MSMFGHVSSSTYEAPAQSTAAPFLDPKNFNILETARVGNGLIALVHYPGTTTFEGNKVLVFDNVTPNQLRSAKTLDPHFCEFKHLPGVFVPIARFENSRKGRKLARICAAAL